MTDEIAERVADYFKQTEFAADWWANKVQEKCKRNKTIREEQIEAFRVLLQSGLIWKVAETNYEEVPVIGMSGEIEESIDIAGLPNGCIPKMAVMILTHNAVKLLVRRGESWETLYSRNDERE